MNNGDSYNRREVSPNVYQCGCHWIREKGWGDILKQCPIHQQHTNMSVEKLERERAKGNRGEVMNYKQAAIDLWKLLDNIDTADDWAKSNEVAYRTAVRKYARKRFEIFTSDGYSLSIPGGEIIDHHPGTDYKSLDVGQQPPEETPND